MKHVRNMPVLPLILVFAVTALATGQEMQKRMKLMQKGVEIEGGAGCGVMCKGVDLTEDQEKQAAELRKARDREILGLTADLKVKIAELQKLVIEENPSRSAVGKKVDEIGALKTRIHKARVNHRLAVREILTPEQRVRFDKQSGRSCGPMMQKRMMWMDDEEAPAFRRTGRPRRAKCWGASPEEDAKSETEKGR